mmetsp:Transcript_17867/g.51168  ORF Transcript_17867/g.51168 Transcript_17867/m.51168 type:complete len:481 (+) Transcript_17867:45-1487(+)
MVLATSTTVVVLQARSNLPPTMSFLFIPNLVAQHSSDCKPTRSRQQDTGTGMHGRTQIPGQVRHGTNAAGPQQKSHIAGGPHQGQGLGPFLVGGNVRDVRDRSGGQDAGAQTPDSQCRRHVIHVGAERQGRHGRRDEGRAGHDGQWLANPVHKLGHQRDAGHLHQRHAHVRLAHGRGAQGQAGGIGQHEGQDGHLRSRQGHPVQAVHRHRVANPAVGHQRGPLADGIPAGIDHGRACRCRRRLWLNLAGGGSSTALVPGKRHRPGLRFHQQVVVHQRQAEVAGPDDVERLADAQPVGHQPSQGRPERRPGREGAHDRGHGRGAVERGGDVGHGHGRRRAEGRDAEAGEEPADEQVLELGSEADPPDAEAHQEEGMDEVRLPPVPFDQYGRRDVADDLGQGEGRHHHPVLSGGQADAFHHEGHYRCNDPHGRSHQQHGDGNGYRAAGIDLRRQLEEVFPEGRFGHHDGWWLWLWLWWLEGR